MERDRPRDIPTGMTVPGRRLGDRRVRIEASKVVEVPPIKPPARRRPLSGALIVVLGFAGLIAVGTVLLTLPMSAASGQPTSVLHALFTATSAVCVTGLVVVDTGTYWSPFGQLVILALIQVGGFGFMITTTLFLLVLVRARSRLRDRVLVQESFGGGNLGDVTGLVKRIAVFTVVVELVGAIILTVGFALRAGTGSDPNGVNPLWLGVFHAVSAFNNAGFDVTGGFRSLTGIADDFLLLGVHGLLIVIGGLGYAIVMDVVRRRRWRVLALETKVVLLTTVALVVGGALFVGILEWNNPNTLGTMPDEQRVLNATFKSVTARTAGFNSIDNAALLAPAALVVMALMFIGGASGSTAGGIKVNTFSVLLVAIVSTILGRSSAEAFGRRIPHVVVYRALAVALLAVAFLFGFVVALEAVTELNLLDVLFETVSAMATVGLSRNITPTLPDSGLVVLIIAMFVGRLGPLTVVLALTARARHVPYRHAVESMRIG